MRLIRTDIATGESKTFARYDEITIHTANSFLRLAAHKEAETLGGAVVGDGPNSLQVTNHEGNPVAVYSTAWPGDRVVVRKGSLTEDKYLQRDESWGDYRTAKRFLNGTLADVAARKVLNGSEDFGVFN